MAVQGSTTASTSAPAGFEDLVVAGGFALPTDFAFAPDGRIFVAEKDGVIRIVEEGQVLADPLIDISDQVNNFWDRGLMGIAVAPDFSSTGHVYLFYTFEDGSNATGPKTSRLTRITVDGNQAAPSSETVILGSIGAPPCSAHPEGSDCIPADAPYHVADDIEMAADGTIFLSIGDSAQNGGSPLSLRAQNLDSMSGKVLRINPDGTAPMDNPFWNGDANHSRSKVFAYGFRNPFRIAALPGTSSALHVGDVGWETAEEINAIEPGDNGGWPCYEGAMPQPYFQGTATCQSLYQQGAGAVAGPIHSYPTMPGGASVTGGDFALGYAGYEGAYFFGDFVHDTLSTMSFDGGEPTVQPFATQAGGPVSIQTGLNGDIYYLALLSGTLHHIETTLGNREPLAAATATPASGPPPLAVQFSSSGSSDPDFDQLSYEWDFGDGSPDSTEANPTHTFTSLGAFDVTLTVDDGNGASDTDTVAIVVGYPPSVEITAPGPSYRYATGDEIQLEAEAFDTQGQPIVGDAFEWLVTLHHGTHTHPFVELSGTSPSFVVPEHGDDTWFEVDLTVGDASGPTGTASIDLLPLEVQLNLDTLPPGLSLAYNGFIYQAPISVTTIANSNRILVAPPHQASETDIFLFDSWSNGQNAASAAMNIGYSDLTLAAVYTTLPSEGDSDGDGCANMTELGVDEKVGGRRDPSNPWDFYDTNGDGLVNIVNDLLAVASSYGPASGPNYNAAYDRSPPPSESAEPNPWRREPWDLGPPDGYVNIPHDLLAVSAQFGHTCFP
jgi:glucose/arabinose dehydrogenase